QLDGRHQVNMFVLAGSPYVGELLLANRVDHEIIVAAVNADDHAFIERILRFDEHAATLLQLPERISHGLAFVLADEHTIAAFAQGTFLDRPVLIEDVTHDACAAGQVEEVTLKADESARRNAIFQAGSTAPVSHHVDELALAAAQFFHDSALMTILDVDRQQLIGLQALSIDFLEHHARTRNGQFIAFATHVLDKNGQV